MDDINLNDWLNREQITLDDCLLLAMGENPENPDNSTELWEILCGDKYRELHEGAEQWVNSGELKARKINNDGLEEIKDIIPIEFFSLAITKGWFLPESIHEWLEKREYQSRFTFVEVQQLEPLTDEQSQDYKKLAVWTFVEAIYILQGFNPVPQSSTEQVFRHFPNELNYFTDSIQLGVIGKERHRAGQRAFIDSPANWQAFWQNIHKRPEPKTEGVEGSKGKFEHAETTEWKIKAREIGEVWMREQRQKGKAPGVIGIAKYVEGELSNQNITGRRGKFLDWETIKREALTGITGNLPNGKGQKRRKQTGESPAIKTIPQ